MALIYSLRCAVLLRRGHLPTIRFLRFLSVDNSKKDTKNDDQAFRERLKGLSDGDYFGTLSQRPAVVPEDADDKALEIESELDSHVPLAIKRGSRDRMWYYRRIMHLDSKGQREEAVDVLYKTMLIHDRVKPSRFIFNKVISIHGNSGDVTKAKKLFDMMKSYGCEPGDITYACLLEACGNATDIKLGNEIATKVYLNLPKPGVVHCVYSSALKTFAKLDNLQMTMRALDDMLVIDRIRPHNIDFGFILRACCSSTESGGALALQIWRRFRQIRRFLFCDFHYTKLMKSVLGCGVGNVESTVNSLLSDEKNFNYRLLMQGEKVPQPVILAEKQSQDEETKAEVICVQKEVFDENLVVSSPINLIAPNAPLPDRETLVSILKMSKDAKHRNLCLLGGLEGLIKTMSEDGVRINQFHLSQLYKLIPVGSPKIEEALSRISDSIDEKDSVLYNSYFATRLLSKHAIAKEIDSGRMKPDLVTYGILSRYAGTVPLIRAFFDKMTSMGYQINDIMCVNMFSAAGLDYNAKAYLLSMMSENDISPTAKFIETVERNIVDTRLHVIKCEREGKPPSFSIPFHVFCIKYSVWLRNVPLHPDDAHKVQVT